MKIDTLPIGPEEENVYILHRDGHVLIVDPGGRTKEIVSHISPDEIVDGIILTHGHEDHTLAADDLSEMYGGHVYIHPDDLPLVLPSARISGSSPVYAECRKLQGKMKIGNFEIEAYHTPGHTAGSVCVMWRRKLFSGDTLFAGDIGRCDLYSGDEESMKQSLRFLASLPGDTAVLPGHGPSTTIARELKTNPYLSETF